MHKNSRKYSHILTINFTYWHTQHMIFIILIYLYFHCMRIVYAYDCICALNVKYATVNVSLYLHIYTIIFKNVNICWRIHLSISTLVIASLLSTLPYLFTIYIKLLNNETVMSYLWEAKCCLLVSKSNSTNFSVWHWFASSYTAWHAVTK